MLVDQWGPALRNEAHFRVMVFIMQEKYTTQVLNKKLETTSFSTTFANFPKSTQLQHPKMNIQI
jgi:hypothetical protein